MSAITNYNTIRESYVNTFGDLSRVSIITYDIPIIFVQRDDHAISIFAYIDA